MTYRRGICMKCWGCGIYDNDRSLEFVLNFENLKNSGMPLESIFKVLRNSNYMLDANCILVLADLEHKHLGQVTHRTVVRTTLKKQLTKKALNLWTEPNKRRDLLLMYGTRWGMN